MYYYLRTATVQITVTTSCSTGFDNVMDSISHIQNTTNALLESVLRLIDLMGCDNVVPIYQSLFYDATCEYSVTAVMWVFSASLVMTTFGLLIITFRSAYSPTEYTYQYDNASTNTTVKAPSSNIDVDDGIEM